MFDSVLAGVCKLVEKELVVGVEDALEKIRTMAFVRFGNRADAVLYGRKLF